jgi:2-polyprenyl-6-methoxyphenol hydroxylase-like FAD-dependent oxidoreductase
VTVTPFGKHGIVIGAGIAGLAAAGALAGYFERVTVLERDALPAKADARPGAPQSNHPHALLIGGLRALCELFPGFDRDLSEAGAVALHGGPDAREELPGYNPFPQRDFGWIVYAMSRPLIERVAGRRLQQLTNVTLRGQCRALDLVAADDGSIAAVRCETTDGAHEMLPADLVVDASGRGALTSALLKEKGWPQPKQTSIGINISYASTTFAIPKGEREWKLVITLPDMPAHTRGGLIMPIEGDRWLVLVSERHGKLPSIDGIGFLDWARRLRTPTIYEAIRDAEPLDKIHLFGFPESSWRHYEGLSDFPRGLIPLGDAICRFNPVHGQGMAVAAQEAVVLKDLLQRRVGEKRPLAGLEQAFIAGVQPMIAAAWSMAAIPDFAHSETTGERPADLENSLRFGAALMRVAARDPAVHRVAMAVRNLIEPPSALRDPELVRRVQAEMAEP